VVPPQSHMISDVPVELIRHRLTHTRLRNLFPGLPGWASTTKVKPIWILLKQETVSGSGITPIFVANCLPYQQQLALRQPPAAAETAAAGGPTI